MYWFISFSVDAEQMMITELLRNRFHHILNDHLLGITLSLSF